MAENMERHQRRQEEKAEREAARETAREAARDAVLRRPSPLTIYESSLPSNPLPLSARPNSRPVILIAPPPIDRPSSPVTTPEHEKDAITLFFRWKESKYKLEKD